jgi:acetyl esterase/lipase
MKGWKRYRRALPAALALVGANLAEAAVPTWTPTERLVYREVGDTTLHLDVFAPPGDQDGLRPAIVFFFGGGWTGGTVAQFHPFAAHLAARGMVAICAEYRVKKIHGTDPFAAVEDARSAMRWVRANHKKLGIDPKRIAAGGGSAGGHLAAACAVLTHFDDPTDDSTVSCRPDALVLFNPVIDNGPGGYGHERVTARWREFSPLHNITATVPPTLALFGSLDNLLPVATAERFVTAIREAGGRCDLKIYDGAKHGFFNYYNGKNAFYPQALEAMDDFLVSLAWLPAQVHRAATTISGQEG